MKKIVFLTLILAILVCSFASDVLSAGGMTMYYGYVALRGYAGDKIWGDGLGQYVDNHIDPNGEYFITLYIDNKNNNLTKSEFKCGWPPASLRRVYMDLSGSTPIDPLGSTETKFRQILLFRNYDSGEPIAHLQGGVSISGTTTSILYVDFILDTITRNVLISSGIPDTELQKYRFSNYTGLDYMDQHLIYGLDYESCAVTKVGDQWAIAFDNNPVGLFVYKRKGGTYKNSYLATYTDGLQFGYNTWR